MSAPLFRDERTQPSEEYEARLRRVEKDFKTETRALEEALKSVASLAGMNNTRMLVNSLLDRVEARGDIPL